MALPTHLDDKTYLYLRTPTDLWKADELLEWLGGCCPSPMDFYGISSEMYIHSRNPGTELLYVTRDIDHWEDGFVLRVTCSDPFDELVERMRTALDEFEAWALHDGWTRYAEKGSIGPIQRFFDAPGDEASSRPVAQIFLVFNDEDVVTQSEAIRSTLALRGDCFPVFHFRDGKVLFMASDEPCTIIRRRCEPYFRSLAGWAICNSAGEMLTSDDPTPGDRRKKRRPWEWVDLMDWTFADEEQEARTREWESLFKA